MRGLRIAIVFLTFALVAATAAAAPGAPTEDAPVDAPSTAPALGEVALNGATAAATATASGVQAATGALGAAAHAVADAARALAHGLAAAGAALADAARAAWALATAAAVAVGTAFATLASLTVSALAASARAVATGAHLLAQFGVGAASALAGAVSALASALAGALTAVLAGLAGAAAALVASLADGAQWFAGLDRREQALVAAGATGSAAATGGLAWWLKRAGLLGAIPMYSRLAPSDMLKNPVRARIFEHIRANPGAHPSALAETLGLGWGTTVYHLSRLEDARLVRNEKQGAVKCYFTVGGDLSVPAQRQLAALRNEKARAVATFVSAHPAATQKAVGRALGMSAALVSWHVKRLTESGVLRVERVGKSKALFVPEDVPLAEAAQMGAPTPAAPAAQA